MSRLQAFFTNPLPGIGQFAQAPSPMSPPMATSSQGIPGQPFPQAQQPPPSGRRPVHQGPLASLAPGQLVRFRYLLAKNDPRPLVIVSRNVAQKSLLKGVNLHYLTFPYIQRLLYSSGVNPLATNYNIKSDQYIMDAFRSYSWRGVDQSSIEIFDARFIVQMINMSRTMDPMALRSMRASIDQQINARIAQEQALPTVPQPTTPPQQQAMTNPTGIQ